MKKQRLVVGISGSSGAILGIRLLEALRPMPIETHLVLTPAARLTITQETDWKPADVLALADFHYSHQDIAASIASGSFQTMGMVVIPCSIKSLSAIANSYSADLLVRAADVTLKEGRPLLLVVREAPLHAGHVRLMEQAAHSGAVIFPPVPAFYTRPRSLDAVVDNIVGRVLNRLGIENDLYLRWQGGASRSGDSPAEASGDGKPALASATATAVQTAPPDWLGDPVWEEAAMTLATTGADGDPHAAAVYFAADAARQNLYFFSAESSLHARHLAANPRAAAAIYPAESDWRAIRGLQVRGVVQPVAPGADWERGWQCYLVKFPFASGLQSVLAQNQLYTLRPDWLRLIDNRREFGYKEEWTPA